MHPGLILGAALVGGAAVVGGAYAATTHVLSAPTTQATDQGAPAADGDFLVAVCVTQPGLTHVPDARCVAAVKHAAKAGTDPATAPVAWRYVPSSTTTPVDIPVIGVEVNAGSFVDDPTLTRYTEDALDIYGRPSVQHPSGTTRIITSRGTL